MMFHVVLFDDLKPLVFEVKMVNGIMAYIIDQVSKDKTRKKRVQINVRK